MVKNPPARHAVTLSGEKEIKYDLKKIKFFFDMISRAIQLIEDSSEVIITGKIDVSKGLVA